MNDLQENKSAITNVSRLRQWLLNQRRLFLTVIFLLLLFPSAVVMFLVVIPVRNSPLLPTEDIRPRVSPNDTNMHPAESWDKTSLKLIAAKEIEHLTLRNRSQLASQDSIYLILDLNDTTIAIEIKGLTVHKVRAVKAFISNRILRADHDDLLHWLGQPFSLKTEVSTIPKTPVLIVDAPKDTSEAARLPRKPLEPEKDFVQYSLLFDRNMLLEIKQAEEPRSEDAQSIAKYQYIYDTTFKPGVLKKILNPIPSHQPVMIKLIVPQADARTIYRAIPHSVHARMIINPPTES